jgi:type II secretory pathway component PulL
MQSLDIYLTQHYICFQSIELSIDQTIKKLGDLGKDPVSCLSEILKDLILPRNTSLNLIMDQSLIGHFSFKLPAVSRRKLGKILEYELADFLINDIDEYFYDYRFHIQKDVETDIGVYFVGKDLVHRFIQMARLHHLEIRSILPLNDLIDLRLKESYQPINEILVIADSFQVGIFVYRNGFLISCSDQSKEDTTDPKGKPENGTTLKDLNRRIKAINLGENSISSIRIDESSTPFVRVDNENEVKVLQTPDSDSQTTIQSFISKIHSVQRANQINLLKSNFFLLQEIKKHKRKAILSFTLLIFCVILYLSSILYGNSVYKDRFMEMERIYVSTINKYLPRGTSTKNAFPTLKQQVQDLKETQLQRQRFTNRKYQVSDQLTELSRLRHILPTLILTRFYQTDQSIRIQGAVDSFTAYEQLKTNLQELYRAEQYDIKFSQTSRGEGKVQFSVIVRPAN